MTTREEALSIVTDFADRITDPHKVVMTMQGISTRMTETYLSLESINNGLPGSALFHARFATSDLDYAEIAHQHLQTAVSYADIKRPGGLLTHSASSLISASICVASMTSDSDRYKFIIDSGSEWLARTAAMITEHGDQEISADAIIGLPGFTNVLLAAHRLGAFPKATELHSQVLRDLVMSLTTPSGLVTAITANPHKNDGRAIRTGMAHGVAGVLAALALSYQYADEIPRQRDTIRRLAEWLIDIRRVDAAGSCWPAMLQWPDLEHNQPSLRTDRQHAWCYGVPGISRALYLAGVALRDKAIQDFAIDALSDMAKQDPDSWSLDGPTICHGYSGALQIATRLYADTGDPRMANLADQLAQQVISFWNPESPFGFQGEEKQSDEFQYHEVPGLFGAAGVGAALLDYAEGPQKQPSWDSLLLLA